MWQLSSSIFSSPFSNSHQTYLTLKVLHQEVKNEWIQQENASEYFEIKETKILIILDNASFHKKEDILQKATQEMPNLILEFLAHRLFKSIEQLESLLH